MKQKFVYLSSTSLIVICGLSFSANAQVCAVQPTCESLGFTQKAADCTEQKTLKCPFDTNKVFCGGGCSGFTLTSCDATKGICDSCDGKYKYLSCNAGRTLQNGICVGTDTNCGGYYSYNTKMVAYNICIGNETGKTYYYATACNTKKVCGCEEYTYDQMSTPSLIRGECYCPPALCNSDWE